MGVDRLAAARRGAPPCPVPPRTAGGSLGCGAPLCFRPTLAPSCRRGTPSSLPCLLCPSALRPARAQCGAIRVAALPLLPPLSALAPCPCPAPCLLALPCPLVPPFLGPLVPGPGCPCPRPPFTLPAYTSRSNTRGTPPTPPSPCRSQAPWFRPHRPAACGPLLPPYLPFPPLPFSLSTLRRTLRRTLCRQVARMSQARTRPLPPCPALSPLFTTQYTSQDTVEACRTHVAGTHLAPIGGVVGPAGSTL